MIVFFHLNSSGTHLASAAVAQTLHDRIDLCFKYFGQFSAVLVDTGRFSVIQPGVVEHEPHVVHILPGLLVLTSIQLTLYRGQVNWILHNVKVVLWRRTVTGVSKL